MKSFLSLGVFSLRVPTRQGQQTTHWPLTPEADQELLGLEAGPGFFPYLLHPKLTLPM